VLEESVSLVLLSLSSLPSPFSGGERKEAKERNDVPCFINLLIRRLSGQSSQHAEAGMLASSAAGGAGRRSHAAHDAGAPRDAHDADAVDTSCHH
jgi:hypothetical protein